MDVRLGRVKTHLWRCRYLCLVGLRPAPQPVWLSLPRMVHFTRMNGARGKALAFWSGGRAFDSVLWWLLCPKHCLSTSGQFEGWTIRGMDNLWGGQSGGWIKQPYSYISQYKYNTKLWTSSRIFFKLWNLPRVPILGLRDVIYLSKKYSYKYPFFYLFSTYNSYIQYGLAKYFHITYG